MQIYFLLIKNTYVNFLTNKTNKEKVAGLPRKRITKQQQEELLAKCSKSGVLIAYEDLGAEALRKLYV